METAADPIQRVERARGGMKIFPLPSAVLFPGSILPLHIFEERYREMVKDALATDRVIALGGLLPGWEEQYLARPALSDICCAGVISWYEELPDGRFDILLQGITRARVYAELPEGHSYREVRAELLPDTPYNGPEVEVVRQAILELASNLPAAMAQALIQQAARAHGGELADLVAAAMVSDVERRRTLLELLSPRARLASVMSDISDLIARTRSLRPQGPLN